MKLSCLNIQFFKYDYHHHKPALRLPIRTCSWPRGMTPLHIAAWKGHLPIARLIVKTFVSVGKEVCRHSAGLCWFAATTLLSSRPPTLCPLSTCFQSTRTPCQSTSCQEHCLPAAATQPKTCTISIVLIITLLLLLRHKEEHLKCSWVLADSHSYYFYSTKSLEVHLCAQSPPHLHAFAHVCLPAV